MIKGTINATIIEWALSHQPTTERLTTPAPPNNAPHQRRMMLWRWGEIKIPEFLLIRMNHYRYLLDYPVLLVQLIYQVLL